MTSTDVILGGAIVLVVARHLRATYLAHRHADRPTTRRELTQLAANIVGAVSGTAAGAVGEVAARVGAVAVRGATGRGRQQAEPAIPVPEA